MESYIKYFAIIFCGLYIYNKLLNLKMPVKYVGIDLVLTALLSLAVYVLRIYFSLLSIPAMVVISLIFLKITTRTSLELSITTTILASGFSYAIFNISSILTVSLLKFTGIDNSIIIVTAAALIQFFLITLPFRFKRLKNGMPFLKSKGASNAGVLISVLLLSCVIVLSNNNKDADNFTYVIAFVAILICAVFILFWWRGWLTKTYIEKLRAEEIRSLEKTIQEKEERIRQLEEHNEAQAKIIHKDNKLLPAMELAVSEYLIASEQSNDIRLQEKGQTLFKQLKLISGERAGIIADYQHTGKKLPVTDVVSVDALMRYLFNKANESGIDLELTLAGSVKYLTEQIITSSDISTLLADLVENAIIATRYSDSKRILISIGIIENCYRIDVFDSGIPFEPDTLINLGVKQMTTHADTGGSGIGLMTAFDILNRYNASFTVEEYSDSASLYTKKVSIIFNDLNKFTILTERKDEIKQIAQSGNLNIVSSYDL